MDQSLARIWAEFRENRIAVGALVVVAAIALVALLAPLLAPQNPYDLASLVLMDARRPPGFVGSGGYVHILGTDAQGRDLYSAIPTVCASRSRSAARPARWRSSSARCWGRWRPISAAGSRRSSCASSICSSRFRQSCSR
jgi:hypothetical protein